MPQFFELLGSHPERPQTNRQGLAECIEACSDCSIACCVCADACLVEPDLVQLKKCIRLNLICMDICSAVAKTLARQDEMEEDFVRSQIEAALGIVQMCASECEKHSEHHAHCRICAEFCRRCESSCHEVLKEFLAAAA